MVVRVEASPGAAPADVAEVKRRRPSLLRRLRRFKPWRRVRAGGGVVWRRQDGDGPVEIILVHRPRYDDWSLPKGKLEADETEQAAALREVEEETGLRCDLGPELHGARYIDGKGRHKTVRYWAMTPVAETSDDWQFVPNREVDEVRWVTPAQGAALLSYDRDRRVLRSFQPSADGG